MVFPGRKGCSWFRLYLDYMWSDTDWGQKEHHQRFISVLHWYWLCKCRVSCLQCVSFPPPDWHCWPVRVFPGSCWTLQKSHRLGLRRPTGQFSTSAGEDLQELWGSNFTDRKMWGNLKVLELGFFSPFTKSRTFHLQEVCEGAGGFLCWVSAFFQGGSRLCWLFIFHWWRGRKEGKKVLNTGVFQAIVLVDTLLVDHLPWPSAPPHLIYPLVGMQHGLILHYWRFHHRHVVSVRWFLHTGYTGERKTFTEEENFGWIFPLFLNKRFWTDK